MSKAFWFLTAITVYLAAMIFVGLRSARKTRSTDDFYLGGRRLGPWVTAMSAEASDMSSWLLLGLPGVALLGGLAEPVWTALGLGIGTWLNWLIVAKPIRNYSEKIGATTIPEFFSLRFHEKTKLLSAAAAVLIIVFFVPYVASGFNACGTLFSTLFGIPYQTAMILSAAVIVCYTILGGFTAASITDLIQSVVMSVALVVIVCFGLSLAGGTSALADNAALPGFYHLTTTYDTASGTETSYGFLTILSTMAWGLGYFGMPHILLRFMAIKDASKLPTSRRIGTIWVFISMGVAILIGIIGRSLMQQKVVAEMSTGTESQRIIILLADLMADKGWLLALLGGVVIAGILASTMSTADSQLLAASSSASQNLLQDVFGLKIKEKTAMILARATVALVAVIAVFWAWKEDSVFTIVSFAWAGFGAAFGPGVLFSLFWKRTTRIGLLAGMITGGATIFIWKYLVRPLGGVWDLYELLPAFVLGSLVILVVSLLTPAPSTEITEEFESVQKMYAPSLNKERARPPEAAPVFLTETFIRLSPLRVPRFPSAGYPKAPVRNG